MLNENILGKNRDDSEGQIGNDGEIVDSLAYFEKLK